jgi:hypothetical protein
MSHVHPFDGQIDAAARYQAFLDRAAAARLTEDQKGIRKKTQTQPFDSYIDPDGKPGGNPNSEPEEEQDEGGSDESGGFGKHYA